MYEKFYLSAGLLILISGFGFWLKRTGKPYHGILFNLHKGLALAAVILTAVQLYRIISPQLFSGIVLFLMVMAVLAVIGLFATGAVLSVQNQVKPVFQWLHGILMIVALGASLGFLLLLPK